MQLTINIPDFPLLPNFVWEHLDNLPFPNKIWERGKIFQHLIMEVLEQL